MIISKNRVIVDGIIYWNPLSAPQAVAGPGMLVMLKLSDTMGIIISPIADKGRTVFII